MNTLDADIRLGDGNRHGLYRPTRTAYDGKPLGTGLIAIECRCGWRISSSERMAKLLSRQHLERVKETPAAQALSSDIREKNNG